MENKTWISIRTASEDIDLAPRTLQEWCKAGKVPGAFKMGKDWRIPTVKWTEFKKRMMKSAA